MNEFMLHEGFYRGLSIEQKKDFQVLFIDKPDLAFQFLESKAIQMRSSEDAIIDIVEKVWELKKGTLKSDGRNEFLVMARCHMYKFLTSYCDYTYIRVGNVANRDHSTVSNAMKKWNYYSQKYTIFGRKWIEIQKLGLDYLRQLSITNN